MVKEILLTKHEVAIVDDDDFEILSKHQWQLIGKYAARTDRTTTPRKTVYMHKELINCPTGLVLDHVDGNTLNNIKSNLRVATTEQNRFNQKLRHNSISGYKGVTFNKNSNKYQSRIFKDNIPYSLGYFESKHDAARMYNFWALDMYGEFARLNVITD